MNAATFPRLAAISAILALTPAAPGQGKTEPDRHAVATVTSKDGTTIAYEKAGKGPALILVASALSARADSARLATLLAPHYTVVNYDRRGRGDSGDTKPYSVQREVEDIAALIEAAGGSAFLFGSSSGAVLALEAANALGKKVAGLALFEPPFVIDDSRPPMAADLFDRIGAHLAAGRRGDAVALFMTEAVGVPAEMIGAMQRMPMWRGMEQRAHTLLHDGEVMKGLQTGKPLPQERWTAVTAPTLVIDGERSDPFLRHAAQALAELLPAAQRRTLAGQDHSVVHLAPQSLVPLLAELASGGPAPARKPGSRPAAAGTKQAGTTTRR